MSLPFFDMRRLLEQSGFPVKLRRADCIHCEGHSHGTISFTEEVAYCHRCQWTANTFTLARELGLLSNDPWIRKARRQDQERRLRLEAPIREFEQWRDAKLARVTKEHRTLSRKAILAENVLRVYPDCDPAWNALACLYHRQAALTADLDRLSCSKVSDFLESSYTIEQLFLEWRVKFHAA